ncbi:MAG: hypothetical protein Q8L13_25295 [Bradyrhizobium sp.]|uniref:hypothetical protein n=1 Tax=Bradyrhizobium sp. TaxID=376 RepID=UPI00272F14BB|nr:hypothetical protein [Bradyrhizobium sp.]MDP1869640.1 hypothetical protein [Bradyrhizobium sp.]
MAEMVTRIALLIRVTRFLSSANPIDDSHVDGFVDIDHGEVTTDSKSSGKRFAS